jgi:hypothetical protein
MPGLLKVAEDSALLVATKAFTDPKRQAGGYASLRQCVRGRHAAQLAACLVLMLLDTNRVLSRSSIWMIWVAPLLGQQIDLRSR